MKAATAPFLGDSRDCRGKASGIQSVDRLWRGTKTLSEEKKNSFDELTAGGVRLHLPSPSGTTRWPADLGIRTDLGGKLL